MAVKWQASFSVIYSVPAQLSGCPCWRARCAALQSLGKSASVTWAVLLQNGMLSEWQACLPALCMVAALLLLLRSTGTRHWYKVSNMLTDFLHMGCDWYRGYIWTIINDSVVAHYKCTALIYSDLTTQGRAKPNHILYILNNRETETQRDRQKGRWEDRQTDRHDFNNDICFYELHSPGGPTLMISASTVSHWSVC